MIEISKDCLKKSQLILGYNSDDIVKHDFEIYKVFSGQLHLIVGFDSDVVGEPSRTSEVEEGHSLSRLLKKNQIFLQTPISIVRCIVG